MALKSMMIAMTMFVAALFSPQDEKKTVEVQVDHDVTVETIGGHARHMIKVITDGGGLLKDTLFIGDGGENSFTFNFNGETLDLDGKDLKIGDVKTFETEDGVVTIARDEEGLLITDEEGEEIRVFGGENQGVFVHGPSDEDIHIMGDKVVISGLENIGDEVRAQIEEALTAAGVDKEIVFNRDSSPRMIWVDDAQGEVEVDGNAVFIHEDEHADGQRIIIKKRIQKKDN